MGDTSHEEEQQDELQAVEAIYGDDYKNLGESPISFEVTLVPEQGAGEDVNHVSVAMKVTFTPTYPETPPELDLRPVRRGGLSDAGIAECLELLREAATSEDVIGMPMVYALAEKCIEWLVDHNQPEMDMHQEMMERLKQQQLSQQAADGDALDVSDGAAGGSLRAAYGTKGRKAQAGGSEGTWRADAEGGGTEGSSSGAAPSIQQGHTPVTAETFAVLMQEWHAQRAASKEALAKKTAKAAGGRNVAAADDGLTGRQLFERQGSMLIDTDAGALDEGEEDMMSAPREAAPAPGDEDDEGGAASAAGGSGGDASLLATVGDEDLFDEDEDLPDDED